MKEKVFDWAAYFWDFVEKKGIKMDEPEDKNKAFNDYLDEMIKNRDPNWVFKPCAWYNVDGDQLEVSWSDEPEYYESLQGRETDSQGRAYNVMAVGKSIDKNVYTGVKIYSIKHILKEAGFKIVPLEENEAS